MGAMTKTAVLLATLAVTSASLAELSAQAPPAGEAPTPACALLSAAEIRQVTGFGGYLDYVDGDPPGEGAGGGSSCQYDGPAFGEPKAPMVSLVLIPGKGWTERARTRKLPEGCTREPVAGVGDAAFFEVCPVPRAQRTAPLYVKAGANDLMVQMDIKAPASEASARAAVIAIAKTAVAKLR